ncbi:hypothetical protein L3Q82_019097 [Scortum barcoo]|uniref:Uncharacterized protein n=1 Tax=Scortum barcoo TaxID=214431 RepID=A0ACB8VG67_9TELE|nr:hypothetical protein L3Q82_019097 [Scortum barcoo]
MIDFVVNSSDLRPYVLDTRVKRGAVGELDPLAEEEVGQTWQTQTCIAATPEPGGGVDTGSKGCRQAEEGVLSAGPCWPVGLLTQLTGYRQAKQAAARTVLEAKTQVWEEFGEAMEEDYHVGPRRDSGKPSGASEGGSSTLPTLFIEKWWGELLTSTGDIVGRWKKYLEDLLNPTDLPSNEEAGGWGL